MTEKVYIDTGRTLHDAVVEKNLYIAHISKEFARVYTYQDYVALAAQPTAQPTSLIFANVTATQMDLSWTAASPAVDGYIVLRRSGASPTYTPIDGTTYSVDDVVGDSTVEFFGAGVSFTDAGLTGSTTYYYDIFSFNGTTGTYNYLTTSPLENSQATSSSFSFGNCLRLDGANDKGSFTETNFGQVQSYEFWIKFDAITENKILISRTTSASRYISVVNSTGVITFASQTISAAASNATSILDGSWHHVAISRNLRVVRLYFDGSNSGGDKNLGSDADQILNVFGCYQGASNFFNGAIDEFRIYGNYVLSDAEVLSQYNSGLGAPVLTKAANAGDIFWDMNQVNSNTTTTDASGNGNTLTITGLNFDANSGWETH